jgi:hypothetical protein
MIWRRKDPQADHFPKFHHHEARISALEADFVALNKALILYFEKTSRPGSSDLALAVTLRTIITNREETGK